MLGPPFYALRGVSGSCCSRRLWIACQTLNRFWIACHPSFSSRPCCCLIYCLDYLARVSSNVSLNEYPAHTQHREKRSVPHNRSLVRYRTHLAGIGEYTCRPGDFLGVHPRSKKRMKVCSTAAAGGICFQKIGKQYGSDQLARLIIYANDPSGWVEAVKNPVDQIPGLAWLLPGAFAMRKLNSFHVILKNNIVMKHKAKYRHRRHFAEKAHLLRYYEAVLGCPAIAMLTTESGSLPRKRPSMPS